MHHTRAARLLLHQQSLQVTLRLCAGAIVFIRHLGMSGMAVMLIPWPAKRPSIVFISQPLQNLSKINQVGLPPFVASWGNPIKVSNHLRNWSIIWWPPVLLYNK